MSYGSDAPIPAGGCTIQVNVTGTSTTRNTYYTDSIAAGALQTTQGANAAAANATVTVHGGAATVPNLAGMSQSAAATALQAAGYTLGTVTRAAEPSTVPYNSVLRQVPAPGTAAAPGPKTLPPDQLLHAIGYRTVELDAGTAAIRDVTFG